MMSDWNDIVWLRAPAGELQQDHAELLGKRVEGERHHRSPSARQAEQHWSLAGFEVTNGEAGSVDRTFNEGRPWCTNCCIGHDFTRPI